MSIKREEKKSESDKKVVRPQTTDTQFRFIQEPKKRKTNDNN